MRILWQCVHLCVLRTKHPGGERASHGLGFASRAQQFITLADIYAFVIASLLSPACCYEGCAVSNFLKQNKCHFVTSAYKQSRVFTLLANTVLVIAGHGNVFVLKEKN